MNAITPQSRVNDTVELFTVSERDRWEVEYEAFCQEQARLTGGLERPTDEQALLAGPSKRPFILYPRPGGTHRH